MINLKDTTDIIFNSLRKEEWLKEISSIRNTYKDGVYKKNVRFVFDNTLKADSFQPIHLVTLACLIHFLDAKGHMVYVSSDNDSVVSVLFEQLRFPEYWSGGKNHVDATDSNVFNLWRIVEAEKDLYAKNVEQYFKNTFFRGKDLSVISLSMVEAYYNVFDHADADGNAFSLIKYEEAEEVLHVAICDFGKGIAKSVRDFNSEIQKDTDALLKSIEIDFTVGSKAHNKGKGLDNILSCSDVVRIVSNNALLLKISSDIVKAFKTDFHFSGTLIYFEIALSKMEDEEILEEFEL